MLRIPVLVALAIACSPRATPQPRPPDRDEDTVAADRGPADAAPWLVDPAEPDAPPGPVLATACPASFASAGGACSYGELCTYAEGSCVCSAPPWCGGMAPAHDRPRAWQCTPAIRADGCPGRQPAADSTCKPEGTVCDYTCSCVSNATCKRGRWVIGHGPCKP